MPEEVGQAALDRALTHDDLLLNYQPIHDARTSAIVSAEALLRQRRQSGETREAGIIAEAAEKSPGNERCVLGSWMMETAFRDAAIWQSNGGDEVRLNVNLSPLDFEEGDIVERLKAIMEHAGLDARKLILEITETSYIERPRDTVAVLEAVKDLGVALWLDDFGTRHSTLTHLQHFPLDGLKIPGTFIAGLVGDSRCRAITRALIGLGHELGLKVTAEEVETEKQLALLREADCDYVQGFLLSRPMSAAALTKALR